MEIIKDDDIHLKFLLGLPVHIEGIGNFYAPSLTDIVDMTEEIYNMSISSLFFDKNQLENSQIELNKYSNFYILVSKLIADPMYRMLFFNGLSLHLDTKPQFHSEGIVYFGKLSEDSVLTEEKFEYIKKLVRIANNLAEPEKYDAANEKAKKLIEKIKKNRKNVKVPQKMNLHSIISSIGWRSQNFRFIRDLNIYQLYDGVGRLNAIDNYNYTMFGIYNGKIDGSKIKLPDINWANIIKNN
ncbi:hypothetical protein JK635_01870 [Neobacillus sp. YIM B02564]|uniref:Uncharacterized protein n=1 Tax=Neobacillus paridis TaxID=2803862 RepID=A0ABS1TI48_9BACI|nr:hypothetical protein [Neobacillus paridis]MBL4950986.1 hypothetical protein [Neobacillus paridis]